MITIFTAPKAFSGSLDFIQRNAIKSWTLLEPRPEIILLGDERGVPECAAEFGAKRGANVAKNKYGTPLIPSIFQLAEEIADNDLLCFANTDVILFQDFMSACARASSWRGKFLVVGSRRDTYIDRLVVDGVTSIAEVKEYARANGVRWGGGSDYFIFKKGLLLDIPPFAIGRYYWDNWIMFESLRRGAFLVDASRSVTALHQRHPIAREDSEEARENKRLAGEKAVRYSIKNATHILYKNIMAPALGLSYLKARCRTLLYSEKKLPSFLFGGK